MREEEEGGGVREETGGEGERDRLILYECSEKVNLSVLLVLEISIDFKFTSFLEIFYLRNKFIINILGCLAQVEVE